MNNKQAIQSIISDVNSISDNDINKHINRLKEIVSKHRIQSTDSSEAFESNSKLFELPTESSSVVNLLKAVDKPFSDHTLLLLINLLTVSMRHTLLYCSQYVSILILTELSRFCDESVIIQRIIPYIIDLISSQTSSTLLSICIHSITIILSYIHTLPETDVGLFQDYLLTKFDSILQNPLQSTPSVLLSLIECLPSFISNGKRLFDLSFIMKKNSSQKQIEENKKSSEETYDYQYFLLQQKISKFLVDILNESYPISCIKLAVIHIIPQMVHFFSSDLLNTNIYLTLFTCMNCKEPQIRAACMESIPKTFSSYTSLTMHYVCNNLIFSSLLDDDEMVLFSILKVIQFLAKHKVYDADGIIDVVRKINCLLFYPRQYIVEAVLDTILSFEYCIPTPQIQILLKDYLTTFFSVPFLSIPWEKRYFSMCLHSGITIMDYKRLYDSICRSDQYKITNVNFSSFYETDPPIDIKQTIISSYITESRAKHRDVNPIKSSSSSLYKSRRDSILNDNVSLNIRTLRKEPPAAINENLSADYIKLFTIPSSKVVYIQNHVTNNDETVEQFIMKYGLEALNTKDSLSISKSLNLETMTLEDFTEFKNCISALNVPPCPPFLGPLVDMEGKQLSADAKPREGRNIMFNFKNSLLHTSKPDGSPLHKICISEDCTFFLTYSDKNSIYLYNTKDIDNKNFNFIGQYKTNNMIQDICICDSSHSFVATTKSSELLVIRADYINNSSSSVIYNETLEGLAYASVVHYNTPLNSNILYTTTTGELGIFDIRSNKHTQNNNLPKLGVVSSMTMCANNFVAAVGYENGCISLFDLRFPSLLKLYQHPLSQSIQKLYTPINYDSTTSYPYIWSVTGENNADCWNIETGELVQKFSVKTEANKQYCEYNPDYQLSTLEIDNFIPCMSASSSMLASQPMNSFTSLFSHSYQPDSNYFLSSGTDKIVRFWNLEEPQKSRTLIPTSLPMGQSHIYTKSDDKIVTCTQQENASPNGFSHTTSLPNVYQHKDIIEDVSVLVKPHHVMMTTSRDGTLKVWN